MTPSSRDASLSGQNYRSYSAEPPKVEDLLEAVLEAQSILISASDDAEAVENALALLGEAAQVDSAHVYQNHLGYVKDRRIAAERFFWDRDVRLGSFMYSNDEWLDYDNFYPDSYEDLEALKILDLKVDDLPEEMRPFFRRQGVGSMLLIPIEVERQFWGFLGMVTRGHSRQWKARELNVLMVAAKSIGQCMTRIIVEQNLKLYREIIYTMHDGLALMDKSGCYLEQNQSREQLLGYAIQEVQGQTPMFNYGEDVAHDMFVQLLDKGLYTTEVETTRKNGQRIIVHLSVFPVNDEYGEPICYLEVCRDITQRKRQEHALIEAKMLAEEANRAKSEFLANMSHEIRTPMNGVVGMSRLLLETELDEQQRDYTMTLRTSSEQLMQIISDILDFSKIEAGKMKLEVAPFNLHQLVEEAVELFTGQAKEKGLELTCYLDLEVPEFVIGDALRLSQVVNNLVNNALKFTRNGFTHLELSLAPADLQNPFEEDPEVSLFNRQPADHSISPSHRTQIMLRVSDSGPGISQTRLRAMFDPFTQADSSTTRRFGGTGLGLSISRLICEMMAGAIWAESEEGSGSTFIVTVPLERDEEQKPSTYTYKAPPALEGRSLRIVERGTHNRQMLSAYGAHWGMKVLAPASTPKELADLLERENPGDIMLVDLGLLETVNVQPEDLQAHLHESETATIFTVPIGQRVNLRRQPDSPSPGLLQKPITATMLFNCLVDSASPLSPPAIGSPRENREKVTDSFKALAGGETKRQLRILVVEDNLINQKVIVEYLSKLGYRPTVVDNGYDAVRKTEESDFDLIFMDVQMPQLDGLKTTRMIRAHLTAAERKRPVIIALTARAMKGDREECLAAGMDDYIPKPVEISKLKEIFLKQHFK